jgi:PAS domain S-box-containing protein
VEEKTYGLRLGNLIAWVIIIVSLYIVSLKNYLLFHILAELFSVLVAYIVFLIIWKSKGFISNRYLIFVGTAYFFIGSYDLLHTLAFRGMGIFPVFDSNPSVQFWTIARYLESTSFLIAPLLLKQNKDNEANDSIFLKNSRFARRIFLIYAIITAYLLISVLYFKNFPTCYIEGSGVTPFKIISEYVISFVLLCSLVFLSTKKDRFETKVFKLLAMAIVFTLLGDIPFLFYSHMEEFPSVMGHFFKVLSFYYLYLAIAETGFEEPYSRLFRELTQREEALKQEAAFLTNEQTLIYNLLGVKKDILEKKPIEADSHRSQEDYRSVMQNFSGILFQLDKDFLPVLIEGSIEEITGYSKEDFLSGNVKWADIIIPEYLPIVSKKVAHIESKFKSSFEKEYRIRRKNGEIKWVKETFKQISGDERKFQGSIHDITQRKKIEETLRKQDEARIKEIHHRIKNNLQVISSLLDLQAEKFDEKNVTEAFKESQNRVVSMALIHEELYRSKDMSRLDFASYLQRLATDLLDSYTVNNRINLKLNLEQIYLGIDTAIPLGIIVNELISNSLKYAFQPGKKGEISISLYESENYEKSHEKSADSRTDSFESQKYLQYTLVVADNGSGIPEEINIENTDSLGLQLINILVDQIEGHLELKRDAGTEFRISFNNI